SWEARSHEAVSDAALQHQPPRLRADVLSRLQAWPFGAEHQAEHTPNLVVPPIDVGAELDPRSVPKGRVVEQPDRDLGFELHIGLVAAGHRFLKLVEHAVLLREPAGKTDRVLNTHATVAAVPLRKGEQLLERGIVQVDLLRIVKVELHEAERILGPRFLDPAAILLRELVLAEPRRALLRDFFLTDGIGDPPFRIGHQLEKERLELWSRLLGLAGDDVAVID